MTNIIKLTILLVFLPGILQLSCTSLKRYYSAEIVGTDNSLADVDLFGFRLSSALPEKTSKTLWDLSADAQSQYIKILNARFPDNKAFINAMSLQYLSHQDMKDEEDLLTKDLRLVFSVSKTRGYGGRSAVSGAVLSSADRIEYLKISLILQKNPNIRFRAWNHFSTEYGTIDIGGVSFTRSMDINAENLNSAEWRTTSSEASVVGKASFTKKEDQQIRYRYILLNGMIRDNMIVAEEEGTREIDLTGNLNADVSLEFEGYPLYVSTLSELFDSTGKVNQPGRISLRPDEIRVPKVQNDSDTIYAELKMDYVFRNVVSGQRTFQEWDDKVRYYKGSVTKTVILLRAGDYIPEFFCIGNPGVPADKSLIRILSAGTGYSLVFRSREEAESFLCWLGHYYSGNTESAEQLTISGYSFFLGEKPLDRNTYFNITGIRVLPFFNRTGNRN